MVKDVGLVLAGVVFFVVAVLHLVRLIYRVRVTIGGREMAMSVSVAGLVVAIILGALMIVAVMFG